MHPYIRYNIQTYTQISIHGWVAVCMNVYASRDTHVPPSYIHVHLTFYDAAGVLNELPYEASPSPKYEENRRAVK
jgi:hypothetical protein